jgi:hypothetical protein
MYNKNGVNDDLGKDDVVLIIPNHNCENKFIKNIISSTYITPS